jgi:hypothetical protein
MTAGLRELLAPLVALYAAASVERELTWYMGQEVVPARVSGLYVFVCVCQAWFAVQQGCSSRGSCASFDACMGCGTRRVSCVYLRARALHAKLVPQAAAAAAAVERRCGLQG